MAKQMVATETFRANIDGFSELITAGETIFDADHPTVKEYPERFTKADKERPDVEEATAEPGKKRGER